MLKTSKNQTMQNKDLKKYRLEYLERDLENMEIKLPSEEWTNSLMTRINHTKLSGVKSNLISKRAVILVAIAVLNFGAYISYTFSSIKSENNREDQLKMVSKELLINPISLTD